jgi:crossover junction endodeoxyribonuclease RuvC
MRVMGIDPGFHRCGYAVVETAAPTPSLCGSGVIVTRQGEVLAQRLHALALDYVRLLEQWRPGAVAVEEIFFAKNVKTAIGVAQARGVILERSAAAGISVVEYAPTTIKSQLTGNGQADKNQVAYMVRRMIELPPQADEKRLDDELDAIAVALCHCMRASIPEVMR